MTLSCNVHMQRDGSAKAGRFEEKAQWVSILSQQGGTEVSVFFPHSVPFDQLEAVAAAINAAIFAANVEQPQQEMEEVE